MKSILKLSALSGAVMATATSAAVNPITRVAELLEGLSKKIEVDGKAEEKLFTAYKCWYKQTTAEKTQSNAEAEARIETLTTFIDDVKNGRIEFTTDRVDREKELAAIIESMEKAKALREQEKADFDAAKDEMTKAINALTEAVGILADGAPVEGSFLARKFSQRTALELAKTQLSTSDYQFLRRALDEQPENKDWNKLNKKATFKAKYKARSGEIQGTLKSMLSTFEDNLSEAETKEADAVSTYEKLKASKTTEREEAEQALLDLKEEMGARGMSLEEAETEKSDLETQVENDTKFIAEVQAAYDAKVLEWKERQRLRTEEIASISNAIGILRSDDARDLFKKSFSSQGYFFVQLKSETGNTNERVNKAMALIYQTYKKSGASQQQLAKISAKMARAVEGVEEVITAIDEMLVELGKEEENDLTWKEDCEKDTMENQKEALKHSREMDDQTALIARKVARMEELTEKIAVANKDIKNIEAQLAEATKMREDEKAEFESNKADDKAAVELIEMAMDALAKFYKDNADALALMQVKASTKRVSAPGEAPAPPPTTFDSGYGGEKDEHDGVVGILGMIKDDVEKDIATAEAAEKKAVAEYKEFKKESETNIANLEKQIDDYEAAHAKAETAKSDAETAHGEAAALLKSTMDALAAMKADCDFIAVNFLIRKENRQAEVDGLKKAKTILKGGSA